MQIDRRAIEPLALALLLGAGVEQGGSFPFVIRGPVEAELAIT